MQSMRSVSAALYRRVSVRCLTIAAETSGSARHPFELLAALNVGPLALCRSRAHCAHAGLWIQDPAGGGRLAEGECCTIRGVAGKHSERSAPAVHDESVFGWESVDADADAC